jgi:hypothetical protein
VSQFGNAMTDLVGQDPSERISAIKGVVIEKLRATDSRMRIEMTDHFNHSFVPDLVLSWPGQTEKRRVFLRTSYRTWDLLRDVDLLSDERPILMPLVPIREHPDEADSALQARTQESRTLVTDPYGLEAFDEEREAAPVVSLLTHAVLQGGRGLISSRRAHEISGQVGAGFSGARAANYDATSVAVAVAETTLDSHRASQMNRLLHALWIGSGAPPSAFPGATGVTAALDEEALRFILEMPDLDDDVFWSRLGLSVTTERLCELVDFSGNANLQRLLRFGAHRLTAKACRVVPTPQYADDGPPRWSIASRTLTLQSSRHRIHFAPRSVGELPENSQAGGAVSVPELKTRAEAAAVDVAEVRLTDGDATLTYGAAERPDVAQDEFLSAVVALLDNSHVASVVARVGSGSRTVRCTFGTGTGAGNSSARYYVAELATIAAPLLGSMTTPELAAIRSATFSGATEDEPVEEPAEEDDPSRQ